MRKSKHARLRMVQRGITRADVDTILDNGCEFGAMGGAKMMFLTREKYQRLRMFYESQLRILDRLRGKTLVMSPDHPPRKGAKIR